jgi:hypothetical protein
MRPGEDKRFTFRLIWDVAEVLRRHGYPIPEHRGRYDHSDMHRRIGEALFHLIYVDSDLGTRARHDPASSSPSLEAPDRDRKGG